jgi:hypothetical protein
MKRSGASNQSAVGNFLAEDIRKFGQLANKAGINLPGNVSGNLSKEAKNTDWLGVAKGFVIDVVSGEVLEGLAASAIRKTAKTAEAAKKAEKVVKAVTPPPKPRTGAVTKIQPTQTKIQPTQTVLQQSTKLQPPSGAAAAVAKARPGAIISRPDVLSPPLRPKPKGTPLKDADPKTLNISPQQLDGLKANVQRTRLEVAARYRKKLPDNMAGASPDKLLTHADNTIRFADEAAELAVRETEYQKITALLKQAEDNAVLRPNTLFDDAFASKLSGVQDMARAAIPELPKLPDDTPFFHGTRVKDLDLRAADPVVGGAANEYGTALYFARDKSEAVANALKQVPPNLPDSVPGRVFDEPRAIGVDLDLTDVVKAEELVPQNILTEIQEDVFSTVAQFDNGAAEGLARLTIPADVPFGRINAVVHDALDRAWGDLAPESLRLEASRAITRRLRASGINGIDDGKSVALFSGNRVSVRGAERVEAALPNAPNLEEAVASFNSASIALARQPKDSALIDAFEGAKLQVLGATQDAAQETRDAAKDALLDRISRLVDLDDELMQETELAQKRGLAEIAKRQEAADEILINETFTAKLKKERPCL